MPDCSAYVPTHGMYSMVHTALSKSEIQETILLRNYFRWT